MNDRQLSGVIPILLTPFDEDHAIDEDGLRNQIEFNIEAGVHGLGLALGSEIFTLNEQERDQLVDATVRAIDGRVPLVVNTGAASAQLAIHYSLAAERAGAHAAMVIPPSFQPIGPDEILAYYRELSEAVSIPIIVQDIPAAPVPPALAGTVADECEWVRYIKVERPPVTRTVGAMSDGIGDRLTVFGGAGGSYFVEELRRGARGTMPFPSQPADFIEVWDRFQADDEVGAQEVFEQRIMRLARLSLQAETLPFHIHKQLMVKRGLIRTATVRAPSAPVDAITQGEIDRELDRLLGT